MSEFNLSDKVIDGDDMYNISNTTAKAIILDDVKEFIKRLKEELKTDLTGCFTSQKQCDEWNEDTNRIIDKLAGDKLTQRDTNTQTNGEVKDE